MDTLKNDSETEVIARAADHRHIWRMGEAESRTWSVLVGLVMPDSARDGGKRRCPNCGALGRSQVAVAPYGDGVIRATNVDRCIFVDCALVRDDAWPPGVTVWDNGAVVFHRAWLARPMGVVIPGEDEFGYHEKG